MNLKRIAIATASAAFALSSANALAVMCFEITDKSHAVTYRATTPPFGMEGEDFRKGQDNLRSKSLHLRWQDTADCLPVIVPLPKTAEQQQQGDQVFDPNVILRSTPEYMTASGRPSSPAR